MKILKYTQQNGFEEIESPFECPDDGTIDDYLKAGGFGGEMMCEVADGDFGRGEGIRHWYNDNNGSRFTMVDDPNRHEFILTANRADHMALRVALSSLAHVQLAQTLADICAEHGTLRKWEHWQKEERRRVERLLKKAP